MKKDMYEKVDREKKEKKGGDGWLRFGVAALIVVLVLFVAFLMIYLPLSAINHYWFW